MDPRFGSAWEVVSSVHRVTLRTGCTVWGGEGRGLDHLVHFSMWVTHSNISLFHWIVLYFQTLNLIHILLQLRHFKAKGTRYLHFSIKFLLHPLMHASPYSKKKLTGLLIQRMSALSDRDSSGPKSATGWASTLELCFLLSMLRLALVSKHKTTVWEKEKVYLSSKLFFLSSKNWVPHMYLCICKAYMCSIP